MNACSCRDASDFLRSPMSRIVATWNLEPSVSSTWRDVASLQRYEPSLHRNRYAVVATPASGSVLRDACGRATSSGWANSSCGAPTNSSGRHPNRSAQPHDTYR